MLRQLWSGSFVSLLLLVAACAPERGGSTLGDGGVTRDAMVPVQTDCTDIDPASPVGGPCCLALGIDACAANSVCAQLDGRTIPVCYASSSRTYGETCTEVATGTLCAPGRFGAANECRASSAGDLRCLASEASLRDGDECVDDSECPEGLECDGECRQALNVDDSRCAGRQGDDLECSAFLERYFDLRDNQLACIPFDGDECHAPDDIVFSSDNPPSRRAGACAVFLVGQCSNDPCRGLRCTNHGSFEVVCHTYPVCEE